MLLLLLRLHVVLFSLCIAAQTDPMDRRQVSHSNCRVEGL